MGFFSSLFNKVLRFEDKLIHKMSFGILPDNINTGAYNYAKNLINPSDNKDWGRVAYDNAYAAYNQGQSVDQAVGNQPKYESETRSAWADWQNANKKQPAFEFSFPEYPAPPVYTPPPAPVYVPPVDYNAENLAKQNAVDTKKRNSLRSGRRGLIALSALGVTDDPVTKKQTLLGA